MICVGCTSVWNAPPAPWKNGRGFGDEPEPGAALTGSRDLEIGDGAGHASSGRLFALSDGPFTTAGAGLPGRDVVDRLADRSCQSLQPCQRTSPPPGGQRPLAPAPRPAGTPPRSPNGIAPACRSPHCLGERRGLGLGFLRRSLDLAPLVDRVDAVSDACFGPRLGQQDEFGVARADHALPAVWSVVQRPVVLPRLPNVEPQAKRREGGAGGS